jgi:hypothetical protein
MWLGVNLVGVESESRGGGLESVKEKEVGEYSLIKVNCIVPCCVCVCDSMLFLRQLWL